MAQPRAAGECIGIVASERFAFLEQSGPPHCIQK
jgi:hypothetical protein